MFLGKSFDSKIFMKNVKYGKLKIFNSSQRLMSSFRYPAPIILEPQKKPQVGTVIISHGLGDSGEGWLDVAQMLQKQLPAVKFILPSAYVEKEENILLSIRFKINGPERPITLYMGNAMPAWYDIVDFEGSREDLDGFMETRRYIVDIIEKEVKNGIPYEKVVLCGFSQGAACSLFIGYSVPFRLAGVLSLSGYLPLASQARKRLTKESLSTPLLQFHGKNDFVIKFQDGKLSFDKIRELGIEGRFIDYKDLAHSCCAEEINEMEKFIKSVLYD